MNASQWHSDGDIAVKDDHLLDMDDAVKFLRLKGKGGRRWLQERVRRGEVPCHRLSRMIIRFDKDELRAWKKERP